VHNAEPAGPAPASQGIVVAVAAASDNPVVALQVYKEAVGSERCSVIHLTHVEAEPSCDTFFPDITAEGAPATAWTSAHQDLLQAGTAMQGLDSRAMECPRVEIQHKQPQLDESKRAYFELDFLLHDTSPAHNPMSR
jgi:hypothetical protein